MASFFIAIAPAFPGYILSCANIDSTPNNLMRVSRLGFLIGFFVSVIVYPLLNVLFPPRGLGEGEDHHDEDTFVLPSGYDQSRPTQGKFSVVDGVVEDGSSGHVRDSDGDRAAEKDGMVERKGEGES